VKAPVHGTHPVTPVVIEHLPEVLPASPPRGGSGLAAWVGFGILIAVAIVAAAVMLRTDIPALLTRAPAAGTTAEATAVPVVEAAVASAPASDVAPAPVVVGHVRLRVGEDFPAEQQAEIVAALQAAGMAPVRVEALPFRIAASRVGYYRPEDEEAAGALAKLIQPVLGTAAGEVGLRDYAELLSDAEPGRLDLWIGN
jgi:hypothetical protein